MDYSKVNIRIKPIKTITFRPWEAECYQTGPKPTPRIRHKQWLAMINEELHTPYTCIFARDFWVVNRHSVFLKIDIDTFYFHACICLRHIPYFRHYFNVALRRVNLRKAWYDEKYEWKPIKEKAVFTRFNASIKQTKNCNATQKASTIYKAKELSTIKNNYILTCSHNYIIHHYNIKYTSILY